MNMSSQLPVDSGRHGVFTTSVRLLLATTAALWMGTAQGSVGQAELAPQQSGANSTADHVRSN